MSSKVIPLLCGPREEWKIWPHNRWRLVRDKLDYYTVLFFKVKVKVYRGGGGGIVLTF